MDPDQVNAILCNADVVIAAYMYMYETRWYRVFGYLGIVRRASKEKGRELRIRHGNVISAQFVYLYNCPQFEAASGKCP